MTAPPLEEPASRLLLLAFEAAGSRPADTLDLFDAVSREQPDRWLQALMRLDLPDAALQTRSPGTEESYAGVVRGDGPPMTAMLEEAVQLAMFLAGRYGFEGCPSAFLVVAAVLARGSFAWKAVQTGGATVASAVDLLTETLLDGRFEDIHECVFEFYLDRASAPRPVPPSRERIPSAGPDYSRLVFDYIGARELRVFFWTATVTVLLLGQPLLLKVALVAVLVIGIVIGRLQFFVAVAAVVIGLLVDRGWIAALAIPAAGLSAFILARIVSAPYGRRRLFHGGYIKLFPHPRLMVRLARAQRFVRLDYATDALRLFEDLAAQVPRRAQLDVRLRAADSALRAGDPQAALDSCAQVRSAVSSDLSSLSPRNRTGFAILEGSALLGLGRPAAGLKALGWAVEQSSGSKKLLFGEAQAAMGEGFLAAGEFTKADANFLAAAAHFFAHRRFVDVAAAMRGRAQSQVAAGSLTVAEQLLGDARRIVLNYALRWRRGDIDQISARARAGVRVFALCRLETARLAVDSDEDAEEFEHSVGADGGAAEMFELFDQALNQAECLGLVARRLDRDRRAEAALVYRLAAVGALDERRYRLRSQTDRLAWAQRYAEAVDAALRSAVETGAPGAAAQVMEAARLQGVPGAHVKQRASSLAAPAAAGTRDTRRTTLGFGETSQRSVALQLQGELPLRPPPVIRVRGDARLLGPHAVERPAALDLERIAALACGDGAWWWGQWSTGDSVYWSLVPPVGDVTAGRIDWGQDSPLAALLERLTAALPVQGPAETEEQMDARVTAGPLFDAASERELMTALGALLIPEPLRHELRRRAKHGSGRLPLAVAPAWALAWLPWATLALPAGSGGAAEQHDTARLVELADVTLAPSAALLNLISKRPAVASGPVSLAVLNPTGDLAATHNLRFSLPAEALLLDDGTVGEPGTKANLRRALRAVDRGSTLVFGCHARIATPGQPSTSALVLRPGDGDEGFLTAEELLDEDDGHRDYPLPRTVVVLGCESADIGSASGAEWLTLGPALLWAGADETLVTLFPIFKDAPAEAELLSLVGSGIEVREALSRWQSDCLAAWREASEPWYSPMHWACYTVLGRRTDRSAEAAEAGTVTGARELGLPPLSNHAASLLFRAWRVARDFHQGVVTTGHFARQYLATAEMFDTLAVQELLFNVVTSVAVKSLRRERERTADKGDPRPSPALRRMVLNARRRAEQMGSPVTLPAHLMLELIDGNYSDGRLILRLTGLNLRPSFRRTLVTEARRPDLDTRSWPTPPGQRGFINHVLGEDETASGG
jgi:hypothetical protein